MTMVEAIPIAGRENSAAGPERGKLPVPRPRMEPVSESDPLALSPIERHLTLADVPYELCCALFP